MNILALIWQVLDDDEDPFLELANRFRLDMVYNPTGTVHASFTYHECPEPPLSDEDRRKPFAHLPLDHPQRTPVIPFEERVRWVLGRTKDLISTDEPISKRYDPFASRMFAEDLYEHLCAEIKEESEDVLQMELTRDEFVSILYKLHDEGANNFWFQYGVV